MRSNPFFVIERLRGEALPAAVRDAVLARAARLPHVLPSLVDLAAIAGDGRPLWRLLAFEWLSAYGGCTFKPVIGAAASWLIVCLEVAGTSNRESPRQRRLCEQMLTLLAPDSIKTAPTKARILGAEHEVPSATVLPSSQALPARCSPEKPASSDSM